MWSLGNEKASRTYLEITCPCFIRHYMKKSGTADYAPYKAYTLILITRLHNLSLYAIQILLFTFISDN